MRIILSIFLTLLCLNTRAQTAILTGKVTDKKNTPLALALVVIRREGIGTAANDSGQYSLQIPANKRVLIEYTSVGSKAVKNYIRLKAGQVKVVNIRLENAPRINCY